MEVKGWECDVVYDLLPLYMDGKVGEDSRIFVKEHLKKCKECKEMYEDMQRIQESAPEKEEMQEKVAREKKQKIFAKLQRHFFLALAIYVFVIIGLCVGFVWFFIR